MAKNQFVDICKVLSNKERVKILIWLKDPNKYFSSTRFDLEKDGVCVGIIQHYSKLSDSTVSQYLSQLEAVNLILMIRKEKWTLCKLNIAGINEFKEKLNGLF